MAQCAPASRGLATCGIAALLALGAAVSGCGSAHRDTQHTRPTLARHVVVVAPVLNLSGANDFDPLRFTDIVASEFLSFPSVSVVPVNLTMAALARRGKPWVETPEDALDLARELGADATVVTAVTEYHPYDPPIVGLVMQWYGVPGRAAMPTLDPVAASRQAAGPAEVELSAAERRAPRFQLQRVFDASKREICREVREFAAGRAGHESPYGWRRYVKSQELYVRYCSWSLIRTMLHEVNLEGQPDVTPTEVRP